jgi:hypothetical protein
MKYYLTDEINGTDMGRLSRFLMENGKVSGLDRIFWINVPDKYLNEIQSGHPDCKPYVFAVELGPGMVKAEFFIRTLKDMRCSCSGYSDKKQSQFIMRFMDEMIRKLEIRT